MMAGDHTHERRSEVHFRFNLPSTSKLGWLMQTPPPSIANAVSIELQDEQILWSGSPNRWAYARRHWQTALVGIPWTAVSVFTLHQSMHIQAGSKSTPTSFSMLWDLMFLSIGLVMLLSPLWAAWRAGSVYYVITDKRAVTFEKPFKLEIRSYSPFVVAGFERASTTGQGGDIIFMRFTSRTSKGRTKVRKVGFLGLADCSGAEDAIRKLVSLDEPA